MKRYYFNSIVNRSTFLSISLISDYGRPQRPVQRPQYQYTSDSIPVYDTVTNYPQKPVETVIFTTSTTEIPTTQKPVQSIVTQRVTINQGATINDK